MEKVFAELERALAAGGLGDFEVYVERVQSRQFEAKDRALESSLEATQEGAALRVFREGRVAFGYTTDLSPAALRAMAETVAASLPWVDREAGLEPAAPAPLPALDLKNYEPALRQISPARKLEAAIAMEAAAQDFDPRIRHVRSAAYEEKVSTLQIRNSRGIDVAYTRSRCQLGVMAVAEQDGEAESAYEFDAAPGFEVLDPMAIGRAAAARAASYLGGSTPTSRRVPVLLDPLVACEILEVLVASFQGDAVFKHRSYLSGRLGQRVYSELLQVEDDGLLPEGAASCPFDGEGLPGRRLPLVTDGVVANFLLDRVYAPKLGLPANASTVRRGLQRPPFLSYTNLRIAPGLVSDEALLREIGKGLWVTETIGMHAANPVTGDFSIGVQGFLIEGGERRVPVKKLALAGNLHQMMAELRAVGSNFRVSGQIGAPSLAIQEMAVGGS